MGSTFFPFRVELFQKGTNNLNRVISLESVAFLHIYKAARGGSDLLHVFVWSKIFSCAQMGAHIWHIGNCLGHVCTFDIL